MSTDAVTPLRHRMIEDMNARKLCAGTQRGHIHKRPARRMTWVETRALFGRTMSLLRGCFELNEAAPKRARESPQTARLARCPAFPAKVPSLNRQWALSLGRGNASSCPTPADRTSRRDRLN
jgi:hypothetical protein